MYSLVIIPEAYKINIVWQRVRETIGKLDYLPPWYARGVFVVHFIRRELFTIHLIKNKILRVLKSVLSAYRTMLYSYKKLRCTTPLPPQCVRNIYEHIPTFPLSLLPRPIKSNFLQESCAVYK